jgi:predicted DsbA family dithiol-disulfide isomerase
MAAQVGLDFHLDGTRIGDTFDAHRLLALAADKGVDLLTPLYRAYFTDGVDIFDRDALLGLGEAAGLTRADMDAALRSDAIAARVSADETRARQIGVQGVPFFVIDERYGLSGAQPVAAFAEALRQIRAESPPDPAGAVCGPDGCTE